MQVTSGNVSTRMSEGSDEHLVSSNRIAWPASVWETGIDWLPQEGVAIDENASTFKTHIGMWI